MQPSNQAHLKFPGLAEMARFIARLSSGFVADTNRNIVSGHLSENDIRIAQQSFQGQLLRSL